MKYYLSGCRYIIYLVIFMLWPLDNEVAANKRCHFPAKKIRLVMQFRTCIHVKQTNNLTTQNDIFCVNISSHFTDSNKIDCAK